MKLTVHVDYQIIMPLVLRAVGTVLDERRIGNSFGDGFQHRRQRPGILGATAAALKKDKLNRENFERTILQLHSLDQQ